MENQEIIIWRSVPEMFKFIEHIQLEPCCREIPPHDCTKRVNKLTAGNRSALLTWTYCTQAVLDPTVAEDVKFPILEKMQHNIGA